MHAPLKQLEKPTEVKPAPQEPRPVNTFSHWMHFWSDQIDQGKPVGFFSDEREREGENDEHRTHWGRS